MNHNKICAQITYKEFRNFNLSTSWFEIAEQTGANMPIHMSGNTTSPKFTLQYNIGAQ